MNEIVILGFSQPKIMPDAIPEREIWTLNIGHQLFWMDQTRVDRWFEMHRREKLETDKWSSVHLPWLKEKHSFPIYMLQEWKDFPSSVAYPLEEVSETLLGDRILRGWNRTLPYVQGRYYSCSFTYMLALAIFEQPKIINLFGVEMTAFREAWMEAPGVEFWLGQAIARGIAVGLMHQSRLLWPHLYGYEKRKPPPWVPESVAREVAMDGQWIDYETDIPSWSWYGVPYSAKATKPDVNYKTDSGGVDDE